MKPVPLDIALLVILLGTVSLISLGAEHQVVSQTNSYTRTYVYTEPSTVKAQLPSLEVMKRFVTTVIESYNALVDQNDKPRKDFDVIKGYFILFHDNSSSFNVTVMQTRSYYADFLTIIFNPIEATQPNITIDQTHTFEGLFPNESLQLAFGPRYSDAKNIAITKYDGTIVRFYFVLEIPLSDFSPTSDYVAEASQIGQSLYPYDQRQVPTVSQTQTFNQTISQTSTITIQSSSDTLSQLISSPYTWIVALIVIGLGIFNDYYGGYRNGIEVLLDKKKRIEVEKRAAKSVIRHFVRLLRKKKEPSEVKNQEEIKGKKTKK